MKTSVSSYSFSHMMRTQGETQLSVMAKAKEYGFDAIEFTDLTRALSSPRRSHNVRGDSLLLKSGL